MVKNPHPDVAWDWTQAVQPIAGTLPSEPTGPFKHLSADIQGTESELELIRASAREIYYTEPFISNA